MTDANQAVQEGQVRALPKSGVDGTGFFDKPRWAEKVGVMATLGITAFAVAFSFLR